MKDKPVVISLGGSLVSLSSGPDLVFLRKLRKFLFFRKEKFLLIVGGGKIARQYIESSRQVTKINNKEADLLGISATRLNAQLVKSVLGDKAEGVLTSPYEKTGKKISIWGGYNPGNSTDLVTVLVAEKNKVNEIINLSNVDYLYDLDPKKFPQAKKIEKISWKDLKKIIGTSRQPGMNIPFDPVACRRASKNKTKLMLLGSDLKNLENYLDGKNFRGTVVKDHKS